MICRQCEYGLDGLTANERGLITCPECGLKQQPQRWILPWPRLRLLSAISCGPTALLMIPAFSAAKAQSDVASVFVVLALLFGLFMPAIASWPMEKAWLSRRHQRSPFSVVFGVMLAGWIANAAIIALVFMLIQ